VTRIVQVLAILCLSAAPPAQAQMYWRLDLGWSKANDADFKDRNFAADAVICGNPACNTPGRVNDVGDSSVLGGGIGYRFNPNWRGDVTLGYRGGYSLAGTDGGGGSFKSDITSMALMANGYYDFSTGGVRPYVGAGVGWAQNEMDPVALSFPGGTITTPSGKKSGAAFAFMAGVGIPVSGWVLDIGYRYVDLGKIESGSGTASATATGLPGSVPFPYSGAEGKLTAHELTVGIRF
jgi:opacity protein-like surface antigen